MNAGIGSTDTTVPPRHHLLWPSEAGWRSALAQVADARAADALAQWQANGWPLVARRADADAGPGLVCAGIALPPAADGSKPRIALRLPANEIAASRAPLLLRDIVAQSLPGLPPSWQAGMAHLDQDMARLGIALGVFGSLAWQALTGLGYVRQGSDIDLLFTPDNRARLDAGVASLAWHAMQIPLDGEIVFPGGAAVSWKEWRQAAGRYGDGANRVLVKAGAAVRLASVDELAALLPAGAAS